MMWIKRLLGMYRLEHRLMINLAGMQNKIEKLEKEIKEGNFSFKLSCLESVQAALNDFRKEMMSKDYDNRST